MAKSKAQCVIQQKGAEKVYKNIQLIDTQNFVLSMKKGLKNWVGLHLCLFVFVLINLLFICWCVNRKDHERRTMENIDHVQEKLQIATSTLQQAIGGVNGHLANYQEKVMVHRALRLTVPMGWLVHDPEICPVSC